MDILVDEKPPDRMHTPLKDWGEAEMGLLILFFENMARHRWVLIKIYNSKVYVFWKDF